MAKAVKRPAESWIYILTSDRALEEREQSRFLLSPMTYAERAAVRDDMARSAGNAGTVHRTAGELALAHIVSIENFPAGEPQKYPASRADRERYLEQLDDDAILEIGDEIWARSSLGYRVKPEDPPRDGDAAKNSSTPGGTSSSGGSLMTIPGSTPASPASAIPT